MTSPSLHRNMLEDSIPDLEGRSVPRFELTIDTRGSGRVDA